VSHSHSNVVMNGVRIATVRTCFAIFVRFIPARIPGTWSTPTRFTGEQIASPQNRWVFPQSLPHLGGMMRSDEETLTHVEDDDVAGVGGGEVHMGDRPLESLLDARVSA